jgi:phage shock protein PspC (stress-responsive transcriptional regulator)
MIGGVAGGLGEYFDIDPTIIRLLFVLAVLLGGSGVLAYIILWIVIPQKPYTIQPLNSEKSDENSDASFSDEKKSERSEETLKTVYIKPKNNRSVFGGSILIFLGIIFLLSNFIPRFHFGDFWPILLIVLGTIVIYNAKKNNFNEVKQ